MGPAPTLATYQAAAQAVYQPQLQADITTAQASTAADVANEESLKGGVNTDYQTAINNLTQATNQNVAKINQLYTERLGGNFSGLQGNDLGSMFATASQNQATIESTRANALAGIATTETNDQNQLAATISSLNSKYQGQEADYANSNYNSAVKDYNTQQYQQEQLALKQESLNISASKARASSVANPGKGYSVKQLTSGNHAYTSPNGQTSLYQYAAAINGGDSTGTYNTILSQLKTGSATDKAAYNKVTNMSQSAGVAYLQKNNSYIFD